MPVTSYTIIEVLIDVSIMKNINILLKNNEIRQHAACSMLIKKWNPIQISIEDS